MRQRLIGLCALLLCAAASAQDYCGGVKPESQKDWADKALCADQRRREAAEQDRRSREQEARDREARERSRTPPASSDSDRWTRYDPNSAYVRSVDKNPPAGVGTVGNWRYEVTSDTAGKYLVGRIRTKARESRTGSDVDIVITCDMGPGAFEEQGALLLGPLSMAVHHGAVTGGRVPRALGMVLGPNRSSDSTSAIRTLSSDVSRLRDHKTAVLAKSLSGAITLTQLRVYILVGEQEFEFEVSDSGFGAAFEKVSPCWDVKWPSRPLRPAAATPPTLSAPSATVGAPVVGGPPRSGPAGNWDLLRTSREGRLYVDRSSVVRDGNFASVWLLNDKAEPDVVNGIVISSSRQVWELRCSESSYRMAYIETYSGAMGTGQRLIGLRRNDEWRLLSPTSNGADVLRAACR